MLVTAIFLDVPDGSTVNRVLPSVTKVLSNTNRTCHAYANHPSRVVSLSSSGVAIVQNLQFSLAACVTSVHF